MAQSSAFGAGRIAQLGRQPGASPDGWCLMFGTDGCGCLLFLLAVGAALMAALLLPLFWLFGLGVLTEWLTPEWLRFWACYPAGGGR